MHPALNALRVRQRLAGTRMPEDPLAVDLADIRSRMPPALLEKLLPALRPAAVLVPLIERPEHLSVLLTIRSTALRHHAGQVSFPGGGMESRDIDITATALRETHEEVGIRPEEVDVAGYLSPTPTVTGFAVTPVVGFVQPSFVLRVDPVEVESTFEVPLAFLMDRDNQEHSERHFEGMTLPVVTFRFDGHTIWGATAGILVRLREMLITFP